MVILALVVSESFHGVRQCADLCHVFLGASKRGAR